MEFIASTKPLALPLLLFLLVFCWQQFSKLYSFCHTIALSTRMFLCRIRIETNGGAWCPAGQVSKDNLEYLQIDLQTLKVVTLIETQGRFGQGQVNNPYAICASIVSAHSE